jgi:hypothetical protein
MPSLLRMKRAKPNSFFVREKKATRKGWPFLFW